MNLFQGPGIVLHGVVGRIDEDYTKLAHSTLQDSKRNLDRLSQQRDLVGRGG